ncbi:uncharacterized protein BYT42DRAFT_583592 [Radiomyces spectabilis]|uniref:uncharacterized protein n=1 Tax=Radiomyces spectabilis TaxID=64574 RepID=UPI00221F44A3|nr:uncharacterized protein BYT42DRAFT_583592 [Radiomyces spectabilis]KAI8369229.1 hypothetical protein BYT42DRAFT_583592 [Radiomyces spectabilis]
MSFLVQLTSRSPILRRNVRAFSTEAEETGKMTTFRGGVLGFLFGVTVTGAAGYYYLLEEYNNASAALSKSVDELQESTEKVRNYARRIEAIDRDVSKLKESTASLQQLHELRAEFRKLYDTLNLEHLELKTHIWGIEKDLNQGSSKH